MSFRGSILLSMSCGFSSCSGSFVGSWNTLSSGRISFAQWVNLFFAGLSQGSIYALIALGYTLVYGILLMINFAHGEVFMAGAFSTVFLAEALNRVGFLNQQPVLSIILMIMFAGLVSMAIAVLLERIAYRPLRGSPRLVPLITAIGASFFLQYTFRGLYGSGFKAYPQVKILQGAVQLGSINIPKVQIFVFFSALLLMLSLYWLVERTRIGKAMRAVSENKEVARLMGIDIDWVILFTFGVGGFLAGSAGVINGMFRPARCQLFHGIYSRHQSLHCGRAWRHRQYPWRHARRIVPGRYRSDRSKSCSGRPRYPER